jgi:thiamine transporter
MNQNASKTRTLVEGALMIALATVLSFLQFAPLPHGGEITLLSMLPILLMSYRHGAKWGVFTAFVFSIIQLFLGLDNLAYCQTLGAQVGCVLLDYVLAYSILGIAAVLAKPFKNRCAGIGVSAFAVCAMRYLSSAFSGYIVWKDYDYAFEWLNNFAWGAWFTANLGENALCWFYTFVYNLSYMLPETILTVIGAIIIFKAAPKLFDGRAAQ